ncbi:ATP-binding protein [Kibdelosporangium phytohabitans]|uniref:ATP-binding protein n=1 Tax=Kibdelosporangium phytohabitans TaxID=860235 RepID=A0A0N9HXF4_9PSEU|nr:ATP-binding protein [Kibdelosporangium phytohabitans]ALG06562.1 ATP-binding protein [Kibdelosporangium phytohabitans]MBE1467749.1 CO dehydrogenase maturation factor [Kibdelosporangium phytohabitans]
MKIAFVGKGGSGKTTLASLFLRHLGAAKQPVLAVDADINQHLAGALGASEPETLALPTLGEHLPLIKDYLRGDNPRISSTAEMVKTTPAGRGSRLLGVVEDNPIYAACVREIDGVRLAVTGPFGEDDLGVACYHSKVGAVELMLNHMVDSAGEYVVVDMTAGADSFASGLFTRFDVTFLVCEPTVRSIGVYRQYLGYAKDFGVKVAVVGNKISDDEDLAFLRDQVGDDLLTWVSRSGHVRAAERGEVRPIEAFEPSNRDALRTMQALVDSTGKDWRRYQDQAVQFHLRNAKAWANERTGKDLAEQIDPEFTLGAVPLAGSAVNAG